MDKNYAYPLNLSWRTDEISSVLSFLNKVEQAYEGGVPIDELMQAYKNFKEVVPSKGEERQIDRDFEVVSGYSTYRALQAARQQEKGKLRLGS